METQTSFCSDLSRALDEPMIGTALRADVWLLLEYSGAWGHKAFEESSLDQAVKDHLSAAQDSIPNTRLQLIRKDRQQTGDAIHFYLADSSAQPPRLHAFQLDSYDDLLKMDIQSIASGDPAYNQYLDNDPLCLVCTNGKRDQCCAKYGTPIYQYLCSIGEQAVWQASHVGMHRFAPIMITLPHGIYYGRIEQEEAATIVEKTRAGQLYLEKCRGRSSYSPIQQAGEYLLRAETGDLGLDAYRLNQADAGESGRVDFISNADGQIHALDINVEQTGTTLASCGLDKQAAIKSYELLRHSITPGEG